MTRIVKEHLETTMEDDSGAEWDIRVYFDYQPSERHTYDQPACDQDASVNSVERNEPIYDVATWFEFQDYSEFQQVEWETEILELINKGDE